MSRSSSSAVPVIIGIAIVAVLLVLLVGAGGVGVQSSSSGPPGPLGEITDPPADGSSGVVLDTLKEETRWNFFGLKIGRPKYRAFVAVVLPEGCSPSRDRVEATGGCAGAPATGTLSGSGTGRDGQEFVIVGVEISEACYGAVQRGDPWPSPKAECQ